MGEVVRSNSWQHNEEKNDSTNGGPRSRNVLIKALQINNKTDASFRWDFVKTWYQKT